MSKRRNNSWYCGPRDFPQFRLMLFRQGVARDCLRLLAGRLRGGMTKFCMHISGDKEARVEIEADNVHEAINYAMNALSKFAGSRFPPPEHVSIAVVDEAGKQLAMLSLSFKIEYADHIIL